jgi:hypothetical protein
MDKDSDFMELLSDDEKEDDSKSDNVFSEGEEDDVNFERDAEQVMKEKVHDEYEEIIDLVSDKKNNKQLLSELEKTSKSLRDENYRRKKVELDLIQTKTNELMNKVFKHRTNAVTDFMEVENDPFKNISPITFIYDENYDLNQDRLLKHSKTDEYLKSRMPTSNDIANITAADYELDRRVIKTLIESIKNKLIFENKLISKPDSKLTSDDKLLILTDVVSCSSVAEMILAKENILFLGNDPLNWIERWKKTIQSGGRGIRVHRTTFRGTKNTVKFRDLIANAIKVSAVGESIEAQYLESLSDEILPISRLQTETVRQLYSSDKRALYNQSVQEKRIFRETGEVIVCPVMTNVSDIGDAMNKMSLSDTDYNITNLIEDIQDKLNFVMSKQDINSITKIIDEQSVKKPLFIGDILENIITRTVNISDSSKYVYRMKSIEEIKNNRRKYLEDISKRPNQGLDGYKTRKIKLLDDKGKFIRKIEPNKPMTIPPEIIDSKQNIFLEDISIRAALANVDRLSLSIGDEKLISKDPESLNLIVSKYPENVQFLRPYQDPHFIYLGNSVEYWTPHVHMITGLPVFKKKEEIQNYIKLGNIVYIKYQSVKVVNKVGKIVKVVYFRKFLNFEDYLKEWQKEYVKLFFSLDAKISKQMKSMTNKKLSYELGKMNLLIERKAYLRQKIIDISKYFKGLIMNNGKDRKLSESEILKLGIYINDTVVDALVSNNYNVAFNFEDQFFKRVSIIQQSALRALDSTTNDILEANNIINCDKLHQRYSIKKILKRIAIIYPIEVPGFILDPRIKMILSKIPNFNEELFDVLDPLEDTTEIEFLKDEDLSDFPVSKLTKLTPSDNKILDINNWLYCVNILMDTLYENSAVIINSGISDFLLEVRKKLVFGILSFIKKLPSMVDDIGTKRQTEIYDIVFYNLISGLEVKWKSQNVTPVQKKLLDEIIVIVQLEQVRSIINKFNHNVIEFKKIETNIRDESNYITHNLDYILSTVRARSIIKKQLKLSFDKLSNNVTNINIIDERKIYNSITSKKCLDDEMSLKKKLNDFNFPVSENKKRGRMIDIFKDCEFEQNITNNVQTITRNAKNNVQTNLRLQNEILQNEIKTIKSEMEAVLQKITSFNIDEQLKNYDNNYSIREKEYQNIFVYNQQKLEKLKKKLNFIIGDPNNTKRIEYLTIKLKSISDEFSKLSNWENLNDNAENVRKTKFELTSRISKLKSKISSISKNTSNKNEIQIMEDKITILRQSIGTYNLMWFYHKYHNDDRLTMFHTLTDFKDKMKKKYSELVQKEIIKKRFLAMDTL